MDIQTLELENLRKLVDIDHRAQADRWHNDSEKSVGDWFLILSEEIGEIAKSINKDDGKLMLELVQAIAVAETFAIHVALDDDKPKNSDEIQIGLLCHHENLALDGAGKAAVIEDTNWWRGSHIRHETYSEDDELSLYVRICLKMPGGLTDVCLSDYVVEQSHPKYTRTWDPAMWTYEFVLNDYRYVVSHPLWSCPYHTRFTVVKS